MKKVPKDSLKQFLSVKNETLTSADLFFYGDIVSDWWGAWNDTDQYPEAIREFLKGCEGKDLNIYINSGAVQFLPELQFTICCHGTRASKRFTWTAWRLPLRP